MKTHTGIVKFFDPKNRFGFILLSDAIRQEYGIERDLYVYSNNVLGPVKILEPEQEVQFSIAQGERSHRAVNVVILDRANGTAPRRD